MSLVRLGWARLAILSFRPVYLLTSTNPAIRTIMMLTNPDLTSSEKRPGVNTMNALRKNIYLVHKSKHFTSLIKFGPRLCKVVFAPPVIISNTIFSRPSLFLAVSLLFSRPTIRLFCSLFKFRHVIGWIHHDKVIGHCSELLIRLSYYIHLGYGYHD